jgi:FAD/FMN-containing dehydrogenase
MNAPAGLALRITQVVGPNAVITAPTDTEPFTVDWRGQYRGRAAFVVKPATAQEVAQVVAILAEAGVGIVPQGGNTSLCGASVPDASGTQVVVNLSRLNKVRALDLENDTVTVEAGCILAELQRVADEADRFFPLSLAAEGTCEIGGTISTNAGGTQVLRYGNMREQVLGLEVVLPDGRLWDGLRGLRKDNTGYDLKHLFIGAEGTLGIVTAAVLKLYPKPRAVATAFVAVPDAPACIALLARMRGAMGERLTGFEILSRRCLALVVKNVPGSADPFASPHPWYALVECFDSGDGVALAERLENTLASVFESRLADDAVVATSEQQRRALWALRENISEAQKKEGDSVKHDVSVPVSRVAELITAGSDELERAFPGASVVAFGHAGDGNIHWNLFPPPGEKASVGPWSKKVNALAYDIVHRMNGSISAEHGIGVLKRESLPKYKSALEMELMRAVKKTLDPRGIMNPGKVT